MNPKLTAYALNELPPDERAELEAQMQNDPALQAEAEEMKSFCAMLSEEAADDGAALTSEQRGSVMRAFTSEPPAGKRITRPVWRHPAFFVPTALAACVAFMLVVNSRREGDHTFVLQEMEQLQAEPSQASEQVRVLAKQKDVRRDNAPVAPAKPAAPELLTAKQQAPSFDPPQMPTSIVATADNKPADPLALNLNGRGNVAFEGSVAPGQPATSSGSISGAGAITKAGAGTLTLNGGNTYAGGTTVSGGTMTLGSGAVVPGKDIVGAPVAETPAVTSAGDAPAWFVNGSMTSATPSSSGSPIAVGRKLAEEQRQEAAGAAPSAIQPVTRGTPAAVAATTPAPHNVTVAAGGLGVPPPASPAPVTLYANDFAFRDTEVREMDKFGDRPKPDTDVDGLERARRRDASNETYTRIHENPFLFVAQQPLSTFSIDVDTASYANVRRFLNEGQRPPADAVRLEELINYFPYNYEGPSDGKPFGVMVDVAEAPWQPLHRLVRVALKGREVKEERGAANFVFLVDVSGSMDSPDKLPLVQRSLEMLTRQLGEKDRVALAVYAGNSGLVLPSTAGTDKETILEAIGNLKAGGSTNGASGIKLAYQEAAKHFVKGGVNRVILCTDGDFNVGISSPEELEKLIAEKAKSRVFLSVLGFGTGNLKDRTMETLADKGNGNYAYIDSLSEARKVLVEQMNGTLVTIAKDVKIQVEFNPAQIAAYRLLGYENRILAKEDFNNDHKDAGEIGAGHTVTALYEVVPANVRHPNGQPLVDELKYAAKAPLPIKPEVKAAAPASNELMTVKLRYKQPEGDKSDLLEVPVMDKEKKLAESARDFQFAASVAGFGMLLRGSQHAGELTWDMVRDLALHGKGEDALGYRGEFLQLIDKARGLTEQRQ